VAPAPLIIRAGMQQASARHVPGAGVEATALGRSCAPVGPLWARRVRTGSFATTLLVTLMRQTAYSTSCFAPQRHSSSPADSDSNPAGATNKTLVATRVFALLKAPRLPFGCRSPKTSARSELIGST
jgi:hypothetical protein